ncbi:MAG: vWA domain-containing protein, partial [Akkermansiaceae bacterium]
MKPEDKMIDALLEEHARLGNNADADFLTELEQRLDQEEASPAQTISGKSKNSRYGIGLGIAAAIAIGAVGVHYATKEDGFGTAIASNDSSAAREQLENMNAPSALIEVSEMKKAGKKAENTKDARSGSALASEVPRPFDIPKADDLAELDKSIPQPQLTPTPKKMPMPAKPAQPTGRASNSREANESRRKKGKGFGRGIAGESLSDKDTSKRHRPPMPGRPPMEPRPHPVQKPSGNRYGSLVDNKFLSPWKAPLSTFSVDVDTASYTNVRSLIQRGQAVPADAVRIEEMINYFNYAYPQPGGKHPFSVNVETASCPWNAQHRLVKVGLKGKEIIRAKRPSANLVFLLDVSGSMNNQDKLPLLVDSMKILLKELNADDTVSIVVYAGAQGLALPPTNVDADGRKTILAKLENFHSGGSTNGGAGIKLAYNMAKKHFVKGGINRVILGTDGDFNVGVTDNQSLVSMVEREAKAGVFLTVLGFGQGNLNDSMLEAITNKGNGNYAYIDSLKEGRKVFLDDMMGNLVPIAKDVKIQVEFNPAKVKSYRLIGYANRMLKAEDFKNKRIDAGEIGAGHTVTALYEIVPGNAAEDAPVIDDLKYQKRKPAPKPADREVVDSPELMTVKLAYKQPDATKETESTYFNTPVLDSKKTWQQASEDFKFTSAVSLFGMLQRKSPHIGQGDYKL